MVYLLLIPAVLICWALIGAVVVRVASMCFKENWESDLAPAIMPWPAVLVLSLLFGLGNLLKRIAVNRSGIRG